MSLNKAEKLNIKKQYSCPPNCDKSDKEVCKACKGYSKAVKKSYYRMMRHYRKALIKKARKFQPYDYGFFMEGLCTMLSWMEAYYDLGYNVFQAEDSRIEIQRSLEEVCDLLDAAAEDDDDFSDGCVETLESWIEKLNNSDNQRANEDAAEYRARIEAQEKKRTELYKKAFAKIAEDFRTWWA